MDTTINTPIDRTDIELKHLEAKITEAILEADPDSTATPVPRDSNDTSSDFRYNNPPIMTIGGSYNRKVCRYAKKHKISCKEAFKRLYK